MQEIKLDTTATKVRSLYQKILKSGVEWEPKRENSKGGYFKYKYFSPGNKYWTLILQTESDSNASSTPNYSKAHYLSLTRKNYSRSKMIDFAWHIPKNLFLKDVSFRNRTVLTEDAFKREIDKELILMTKVKN
jgi:hypothetical protein